MKILVCIKQVPDGDSALRINADRSWIDTEGVSFQINDYDRYALEEALRIRDASGAEVVIVSVGPERVGKALRTALAMGADRAIHVDDPAAEGSDARGIARILAAVAGQEEADLVLAGLQAEDDNHSQVGPLLARWLERPCATGIVGLEMSEDGRSVRVHRELEGNRVQVVDLVLPALATVQTGINEPRYASLKGIMAAKKKEIRRLSLADLKIDPATVGPAGAAFEVIEMSPPPRGKGGEVLQGSTEEIVDQLVQRIRKETGVL